MKKVALGPQTLLYPLPAFLIGSNVDGRPNFMTAAWSGIANSNPPMVSVALQHHRYTLKGIKECGTFSINVPSADLVKETDYCGIVSGTKEDKTTQCKFQVFYGKLKDAPLIQQCPLNLECKVVHILNLGSHAFLIGQIEEVHASEACLTDGQPDVQKIDPIVFCPGSKKTYHNLGKELAAAFSAGMEIKKT
ncbi:flavin reductase family protein [Desulforhabdus sp. TSK]|uniref:flavin reductase family protein n=1 Tax=Desulforhabdus sp. TSK TaxID=2925014 RepID=UPI001FC85515|nr:flavin reductase family protein [Desulforhabdus sp. TSK]GKT10572.1 flavodoxin [Desulforhabdus sp. TSK]